MRPFLALLSLLALAAPAWACPTGNTCATYLTFSGESVLVPSGDTTGATDVAAINAAINQTKPNYTQTVVRLGTGTFYINATQILVWPFTTIEGHYLSAADGSTGTPGGTVLKAVGTWSSTPTATGPAVMGLTDRTTLRNFTVLGIGGTAPDCVLMDDVHSVSLDKVDVVGCHNGWNALANSTLSGCGGPPYYPYQACSSQLIHWFLGNVIGNTLDGVAIGGIGGGDPAYSSDSFMFGTNFYRNAVHVDTPFTCGAALGLSWNFAEFSGSTGAAIGNNCNSFQIVGNQISNAAPALYFDRSGAFPIVGNQIGSSAGPLLHTTSGLDGPIAGDIYYQGCPYQADNPISSLAWYETPVPTGFGCNSGSTTNLDSIIIVPGSSFP
jgi:hypothetical protein